MTLKAGHGGVGADLMAELNGPSDLAALCGDGPLSAAWLYTPIGGMVAVVGAAGVHLLEFPQRLRLKAGFARLQGIRFGASDLSVALQGQLTAYFAGKLGVFDLPLALPAAPPFTMRVWEAVLAVPYGQTASYGQIAAGIGQPKAARAMGRANGANPVAILVPCHRITGPGGALTGYAGGLWRKEWLLAHEGRGLKAV
jgi:AraC family transcriptional regulator, regulatory protein of adaptative response / methylated-DNA-[protein]-cysteine methyltransferase